MNKFIVVIALIAATVVSNVSQAADTLTFLNGNRYEVQIVKVKNNWITFRFDNETLHIPTDSLESVRFGDLDSKAYQQYLKQVLAGENCKKGREDAARYHGKVIGAALLGFLFGPFALAGEALSHPTPAKGRSTLAMSPSKQLFSDPEYLKCYAKKARRMKVIAALDGWCVAIAIGLLISL